MKDSGLKDSLIRLRGIVINFLIPIVCLGASLGLFIVIISPSMNQQSTLETDLEQKQKLDVQLSTKINALKRLVDYKNSVEENALLVADVLVSQAMVPQLLTQVDLIARESGLAVESLSYSLNAGQAQSNDAPKTVYQNVLISMAVKGTYEQLTVFFESLENSGRIVNVDSFRYGDQASSEGVTGLLGVTMVLNAPYMFIQSNAVTDDPVNLDISGKESTSMISRLKSLRIYKPTLEEISKIVVIETKETTPSEPAPAPPEPPAP